MAREGSYNVGMFAFMIAAALATPAGSTIQDIWETPPPSSYESLLGPDWNTKWRGFRMKTVPKGWTVAGGVLAFTPGIEGGDLTTVEQYGDFDFQFEWRIQEGGNSGVIYRATEDKEYAWRTGAEYQILDNEAATDDGMSLHSAGSNYALYAPIKNVCRKAGEWNQGRIVAKGSKIAHFLNGVRVVEFEVGSKDWLERMNRSKFRTMEGYGVQKRGHISLQDHGYRVWFRNLKIKPL